MLSTTSPFRLTLRLAYRSGSASRRATLVLAQAALSRPSAATIASARGRRWKFLFIVVTSSTTVQREPLRLGLILDELQDRVRQRDPGLARARHQRLERRRHLGEGLREAGWVFGARGFCELIREVLQLVAELRGLEGHRRRPRPGDLLSPLLDGLLARELGDGVHPPARAVGGEGLLAVVAAAGGHAGDDHVHAALLAAEVARSREQLAPAPGTLHDSDSISAGGRIAAHVIPFIRRSARWSRRPGARVGRGLLWRKSFSISRASTSAGVGGGVRSSYRARASAFEMCVGANPTTTTVCSRSPRVIASSSPGFRSRCGFTV